MNKSMTEFIKIVKSKEFTITELQIFNSGDKTTKIPDIRIFYKGNVNDEEQTEINGHIFCTDCKCFAITKNSEIKLLVSDEAYQNNIILDGFDVFSRIIGDNGYMDYSIEII